MQSIEETTDKQGAGALTQAKISVSKPQSQLELHLLGPPRVELEGLPLEIKRRKALALLIYLAVNGDRQPRDSLATLLWPESSQQSARKALRRDLSELNLALGGNWLDTDRESVGLRAGFGLDVAQFQQYLADETADLQTLIAAAGLYRDDFLTGFTLPDCPDFDEWQFFQGESLRQALASVLERLAVILTDQADYEMAIPHARRWLALDPLHEPAHRQLMQLYAQAGQQAAALRQYEFCRQTLEDELGISPSQETTALYEQIRDRKVGPAEPAAMLGPVEQTPAQAVAGELRAVTVLSVRVSGVIDAEEVVELANRLLVIVEGVLSRYEAQIERLLGEEMLAVFGAPQTHEDDHERALWAALEIQSEAQKQGLRASIGINTGDVYVGRTGSERYQAGTVIGPVVNLASRLGDTSEPGEIVVGPDTYRLTAPLFDFEAANPIKVSDIAEPLSVYRLLGAKTVRGKARGIVGLESPLVGRETEFGALREAVQRLQAGVGGIVTLVGEAGLGKSRLVAELQGQSPAKVPDEPEAHTFSPGRSAVQWVEGRCLSFGGSIAYLLWLDVLRELLGVTAEDPPTAVQNVLRERVETLCGDRFDDAFPYLARLMSLPLVEEVEAVLRGLGNKGLKVGTFRAVEILIESAARQQGPLVVVCEDLHWADPTSLELLEQLLSLTDRAPVLFICLFRSETQHGCWRIKETAARQHRHRHTDLWLETLSDVESAKLVNNLLHLEELPSGLAEHILNHAEGNPFYVEEIIRSLLDNEDIVWDEMAGGLQVVGAVPELTIPDTVRGVLMARIDRLQGETKRVLQLAAVIGRVFLYRVLQAIAQKECDLSSHLSTLQREEMIRERTRIPELEYIFKHQLTQEAAYRTLLRRERRVFHRQVAEALERLYPERIEEQVELLAHHWEQAEEPEKATEYLVRAGQKAAGSYANTEALAYFQRALALAEGQDGYDDILARRAQIVLDMFQGREAAGDYKLLLDRARRSRERQDELEALLGLASAYYAIALDEPEFASEALKLYERAYTLAGQLEDKAGMVRALVSTIWFTDFWTEYGNQAVANLEEAWAISQEVEDEDLIIDCMMAREARGLLTIDQAEDLLRRLEARHDLPRLKEAYFPLLWWYLDSGNFERCVEYCDISTNLAAKLGAPPVMHSTIKALALLGLGRYGAAWEALQEEVAGQEHPFGGALKDVGAGLYYRELMAYEQATKLFEAAIEQAKRVGRAWLTNWAQEELSRSLVRSGQLTQDLVTMGAALTADVLGEIALYQGNLDEALRQAEKACAEAAGKSFWAFPPLRGLPHVEKARTKAKEGDRRPSYLSALVLQLQILLQLGRPGDVIPLADKGIHIAEEREYRPLLWRLRAAKAQAMAMLGDGGPASQEYQAAAVIVRELADTIGDPTLKHTFMSNSSVSSVLERG